MTFKVFLERVSVAWSVLRGRVGLSRFLSEQEFIDLMGAIKKDEEKMVSKYREKLYNIVEMAIPQDKVATMRRGVDDIFSTMVESVNLHVVMGLEKINTLMHTNEPSKNVPANGPAAGGAAK